MKSYIAKIKKYILPIIFLVFTFCLVIFSSSNLEAAKQGLSLCFNSVIPSLFPFFVATELLSKTSIPYIFGRVFRKFMRPLFNISGEGSFAFLMGIISGYPVGAKIACSYREENILSKEECERLLSFTNNSGPLFILGTVGISFFKNSKIGYLLLITHILASITVGIVFKNWKKSASSYNNYANSKKQKYNNISFSNLGEILEKSITNSISTILMICGFVVMFSVIISILRQSNFLNIISVIFLPLFKILHIPLDFAIPFTTGIIEITNGISLVSLVKLKSVFINIILTSFLLGIGGISIFFQVYSIVSKTDLSIKPYILGKLLHGCISAFYTFVFLTFFRIY